MSSERPESTSARLKQLEALVTSHGFEQFGFAELTTPLSIEIYEEWLKQGKQGEMSYLDRHLPEKKEPRKLMPRAKSAIVLTKNYVPHPAPSESWPVSSELRIAAYARGRDYHHFLKEKLNELLDLLRQTFPSEEFLTFTDSGPVLERDLATRAGLGWIGKNTCLIDREQGSLFFIAEIYTSLELPVARYPVQELVGPEPYGFCGTCTRCLDACPTGAIVAPKKLDARLCISYLTIESRSVPDVTLRKKMGDWFFGCDICQTVCPWNLKAHGPDLFSKPCVADSKQHLIKDLRYILTSPNRGLERAFAGTPLARAGGWGLKRNALIVAANRACVELRPEIDAFVDHEKLGELARWALHELGASLAKD